MSAPVDFAAIRNALTTLPSDHDASGEYKPTVDEIFTPNQHAAALDPNTPIVVGARGAGKSFWAGVLDQDETRATTALAYPNLGLDRLVVRSGYSGFAGDTDVSSQIIDGRIPLGQEMSLGYSFWQAVVIRAAMMALGKEPETPTIREIIDKFSDPEDADRKLRSLDAEFEKSGKTFLITFDALDTLSRDWTRSRLLLDKLFEVIWTLRVRRALRAKVFIRPEQLNDESLRFIELPKLRSGRVELEWRQLDLYGLLYWRLSFAKLPENASDSFLALVEETGIVAPSDVQQRRRRWALLSDMAAQKSVMEKIAGPYMGKSHKKGGTYDWPYNHLGDAAGRVTPRSFIKLFVEAARYAQGSLQQIITPEAIRHGLREASKVRVDQLGVEYGWIKRALAPLAGVTVPCEEEAIFDRWISSNTIRMILEASTGEHGFLPPFPLPSKGNDLELLSQAMQRIGLFSVREDGRIDIPDLFRVAALMLKKGGTPPKQKKINSRHTPT